MQSATLGVQRNVEKLSSGYRINKAADDAAGLAISEVLRSDIRSLNQARRNANDAVSMVQVAEGGLEEINSIMIRLRELAIQASSDTLGERERGYLNEEFMALKNETDRIAQSTEFNGSRMLIGSPANVAEDLLDSYNPPPMEIQVGKDYMPGVDGLESANPVNIIRMDFEGLCALTGGEGGLGLGNAQDEAGHNVATKQAAQQAINQTDEAMQKIAGYRSKLGAMQNRFQSTDNNLAIMTENLSSAKSRIKDVDFASESAEYAQNSILQQAGASVLAQANQLPQIALKLLG
jgi:flagellin